MCRLTGFRRYGRRAARTGRPRPRPSLNTANTPRCAGIRSFWRHSPPRAHQCRRGCPRGIPDYPERVGRARPAARHRRRAQRLPRGRKAPRCRRAGRRARRARAARQVTPPGLHRWQGLLRPNSVLAELGRPRTCGRPIPPLCGDAARAYGKKSARVFRYGSPRKYRFHSFGVRFLVSLSIACSIKWV